MFRSRAMSRLSSEHDARLPNMRYQAKNELEPRCCWRALPLLAVCGWADGRPSLGGRTQLRRPFAALRACCRRHGRPAALLLPGRVQWTCLQRLVAWSRHLQAAGLLECCAGTVCRRGAQVDFAQLWSPQMSHPDVSLDTWGRVSTRAVSVTGENDS